MNKRTPCLLLLAITLSPVTLPADTQPTIEPAIPAKPARVKKTKPERAKKTPYLDRIQYTPDINQNMTIAELLEQIPPSYAAEFTPKEIHKDEPFFIANMCAPASVANHLLWLDRLHFKNISKEKHPIVAGVKLINTLGSEPYMRTIKGDSGTTMQNLVAGTYRFLGEKGIKVKKVTVISNSADPQPWNLTGYKVPFSLMQVEHRMPTVAEIKAALHQRAIVVNLFGKYEYVPERAAKKGSTAPPAYLRRGGGHYMAPVGHGRYVQKVYDDDVIIYHDPADPPQNQQKSRYVRWVKETGKNAKLRMIKREKPSESFRACEDNPDWKCYGTLGETYILDKALKDHKPNESVKILEALIVIEV